ncbi:hypothetical protein [Chitinophaga sp. LS1]|uniref:hypothetical protein n=1 Tax=Chitinophaga sp. LS1 TaxID=3051176 RepID=UPI002AAC1540|nr:hypothetical protein [Chitinophaga sp. LS1]WPV67506.1 hypothetical protein QQL36_02045 [Chitinophaga sp. LS1]
MDIKFFACDKLNLHDLNKLYASLTAFNLLEDSDEVADLIAATKKKQEDTLKDKEIDQETLKMVVQF